MSKPAVLFQKPKPDARWARERFCATLNAAAQINTQITAASPTWTAKSPKRRRGRRTCPCSGIGEIIGIGKAAYNRPGGHEGFNESAGGFAGRPSSTAR